MAHACLGYFLSILSFFQSPSTQPSTGKKTKETYDNAHEEERAKKGHKKKEKHKKKYQDAKEEKRKEKEEQEHYGKQHEEEEGEKGAKFEETGSHEKGKTTLRWLDPACGVSLFFNKFFVLFWKVFTIKEACTCFYSQRKQFYEEKKKTVTKL